MQADVAAAIRGLIASPRIAAASSVVGVLYPGHPAGSVEDEQRLLKWAALSHRLPAGSVVVAASMVVEAPARALALSLNSEAEDTGCFVVADPEGRLGAVLRAPTVETSFGPLYAPSTFALLDGAAVEVWHPVDPILDAEIVNGWLEASEAARAGQGHVAHSQRKTGEGQHGG